MGRKYEEKPWDILRLAGQKYRIFQWNRKMDTQGEIEQPKGKDFRETRIDQLLMQQS